MEHDVALLELQESTDELPLGIVFGFAAKLTLTGAALAVTVTVTSSETVPPVWALQVMVYVTVELGDTLWYPFALTAPTPWSMEQEVT